jgi:hypothetical protein
MNTKEGFIVFLFILNIILIIAAGIIYVLVATEKQVGLKCTTSIDKIYAYRDFFCPEQLNVNNADNSLSVSFPIDVNYNSAEQCRNTLGQNVKMPVIPHDVSVDAMHDLVRQKDNCSLTITTTNPLLKNDVDFLLQRPMYNYVNLAQSNSSKAEVARIYTCPTLS